ncbi:unnamed protein product [Ranitomeya imitator]|uniref:Uncharacterized protein n=1 Tax=Ranitomeya imitator TaxID=111125 RepID=A0ABN9MER0_9NEOB|nr:unnamed protein product [Ranitomeya imitator]
MKETRTRTEFMMTGSPHTGTDIETKLIEAGTTCPDTEKGSGRKTISGSKEQKENSIMTGGEKEEKEKSKKEESKGWSLIVLLIRKKHQTLNFLEHYLKTQIPSEVW